ncbi:glycosyltransferase family 4 protein [Prosthecobacter sp.]|uniref:glycosyltransferase family 4 protein n=1 Tax=Prosthecobacter sp. TaxID=1965333 RepID=UPI0037839CFB
MNILYVHERFGALAGAEANAFITAQELSARGHHTAILHGPGTGKNEEGWSSVFQQRFPLQGDTAAQTRAALAAFRPDAVYVHKMADLDVIQTLVESGTPLVRMVHDHDIYCMRSYKYHYLSRKICTRAASLYCAIGCGACVVKNNSGSGFPLKWVSYSAKKREIALNRRFHRMVVVTEYMREELLRNGFDDRRIEIHAPVPRMGDPSLRSSFSDRNLILYAGQIIRGKGVDVLLQSLARMKTKFECIILGDGNHRAYCEKLSRKLGLADRVHFKGFIPQEELKAYYRECSVVALSSVWPEPIATIGLEVMRYALPVVAFDAGGIKDWLKDGFNGHLVPWMNRDAFAASLDDLLQNKAKAKQLGANGLRLVSARYDFPAYIAGLESMFERAIVESALPSPHSPPVEGDYSSHRVVTVPA